MKKILIPIALSLVVLLAGAKESAALPGDLLHTFTKPGLPTNDEFGVSVAGVGNNVLIGAWADDTGADNAGAAYLFDSATGNLLQTFLIPTPADGDGFGWSVAGVGNNVLIGAFNDDTGATNAGSAYLFDGSTGALLQTFNNPTPAVSDHFGFSVAGVGNNVLIGAGLDDTGAEDAGSAYLFDGSTGALLHTFNNPTPGVADHFGVSVAGVGNNVLIGADLDDTGATGSGSAYLFDGVTGALLQTFNNPTPGSSDRFGVSVAGVGDHILVGALGDGTGAVPPVRPTCSIPAVRFCRPSITLSRKVQTGSAIRSRV